MPHDDHKYVFVIGGVMSGVGKGITSASIGSILQDKGYKVNLVKVDPYLNVDAGTMNPTEHGEVFVLNSGLETDQDLGNYERFMDRDQAHEDYITSGMVYRDVIERERRLEYGGKCVEAVPHIRDEIISRFQRAANKNDSDVSVIEIGGTVGDYQNIMFIEAARVLKIYNPKNVQFVLVSYLPIPDKIGEMKTKPTQNAVRQLNSYGVQTDLLIARSEKALDQKRKEKIAISCNIYPDKVISAPDIESIYDVPINFEADSLGQILLDGLKLESRSENGLIKWREFVDKTKSAEKKVKIAVVGKYFDSGEFLLSDAYVSVIEAIKFSSYEMNAEPEIFWLNSKEFGKDPEKVEELREYDGIIVPGGFGERGIEGKINVIRFAREERTPYFGLCYGMQLLLVEYARNVLGLDDANTAEIDPDADHLIIDVMESQKDNIENSKMGGTMRLGTYEAKLKEGSMVRRAYGKDSIEERHRHRYEVNPAYREQLEKSGMIFSGVSPDGSLAEISELPETEHPFFVGTQFHPEFLARPLRPHPLFNLFIKTALDRQK
ncbi:MAG: CTP synthase [Candidatus Campbellbacteria bacterium]|nr:CTP synthase [Candidatus Campbellbacteria bacterium]